MPINFTVVPVEDAEGGAASAGGAKPDLSVPIVVVGEDGDRFLGPDSGTAHTCRTAAPVGLVLSGSVDQPGDDRLDPCTALGFFLSVSHTHTRARTR